MADQSDVCHLQVSFTKLARNLDRVKLAVDELRRVLLDASVAALVSTGLLPCLSVRSFRFAYVMPPFFCWSSERREGGTCGEVQGGIIHLRVIWSCISIVPCVVYYTESEALLTRMFSTVVDRAI
jgi:hypothetical protein